jgi:hypothetical protein
MKTKLTGLLLIANVYACMSQTAVSPGQIEKKIVQHFSQYTPESKRYSGSTAYGEKKVVFEKEQIEKELQLFEEIKKSPPIEYPTTDVFDLCHNILIHSPEKGKEFLTLLNHPTEDKQTLMSLYMDAIFTGEFGEQLALKNLASDNAYWRDSWRIYLGSFAVYESSIPVIEKALEQATDPDIQRDLIGALTFISNPKSIVTIKKIIESTKNDETQTKAIFAYTEFAGYDGMTYLEQLTPLGQLSTEEKRSGLAWLKKETSPSNKYGVLLTNDIDFIARFSNSKTPSIQLMAKEGLLDSINSNYPKALPKAKKTALLDALIVSKGFGLEAVEAQLFMSLEQDDIPQLLALRQACVYSPNGYSFARLKTVGLFIRYLRKTKK